MGGLRNDALKAVDAELRGLGFRPRERHGSYMRQLAPGVHGFVGLGKVTAGMPRVFCIDPTIGVRHDEYATILGNLNPLMKNDARPTAVRPLGYLTPRNTLMTWEFVIDGDHAAVAADLRENITEYGTPLMEQLADWAEVSRGLQSGELTKLAQDIPMYGAVAKVVDGDVPGAWELISRELAEIGDRTDVYAEGYRDFARRFQEEYQSA